MSYNTLFHLKKSFYVLNYDKISVCPKVIINSFQETISINTYSSEKSKYLKVLYPQHIYFYLSKVKDFKTHKQRK